MKSCFGNDNHWTTTYGFMYKTIKTIGQLHMISCIYKTIKTIGQLHMVSCIRLSKSLDNYIWFQTPTDKTKEGNKH
jgi:hypothetical protein